MKTQRFLVLIFLVGFVSNWAFGQHTVAPPIQFENGAFVNKDGKYENPSGSYSYKSYSGGSATYSLNSSSKKGSGVTPANAYSFVLVKSEVTIYNNYTGEIVFTDEFMSELGEENTFALPILEDGEYVIQVNWDGCEWRGLFWIDNENGF